MKIWNVILINIFFVSQVSGQKDSSFFFNEFSLSINQTNITKGRTVDRLGFGMGAYHSFKTEKKINLSFGFEFNRTSQFIEKMYDGHVANSTDITFYANSISIPLMVRLNLGKKTKLYFETGVFLDLNYSARRKGIMHTYNPTQNNQWVYVEYNFNEKTGVSKLNFGPSIGTGLKIPILKHELIFKIDYKFGIIPLVGSEPGGDPIINSYLRLMLGFKI